MPSPTSPFFKLPSELRDHIYHICFLGYEYVFQEQTVDFHVKYGTLVHGRGRLSWMFSSKQFLSEALTQFYREAQLSSYHNFSCGAPRCRYPTLTVSRFEKLDLSFFLDVKTIEADDGTKRAKVVPDRKYLDFDPGLRLMLKILEGQKSCLKDLTIRVEMGLDDMAEEPEYRPFPSPDTVQGWEIDLSYLKAFGTELGRVEFILCESTISTYRGAEDVQAYIIVVPLVQRELERLSKAMVGGRGWNIEDRISRDTYWHLEARPDLHGEKKGSAEHTGLKSWRNLSYSDKGCLHRPLPSTSDGTMEWICDTTGRRISVRAPKMPWDESPPS
ncbi:hypothetical protein K469DRAFT_755104 [Zopfia rhizophila CBS 207.26]|uniref:Uncharacterized protein n=1 Tax=Zopfia rhizophila CBS 207.26 TaxID=1314779 RepID=A0A6A6DHM0_9PEZI|nr:hypothetical protein K469DRAFT_755104 [Zopfia rhizophila CBS 207.26]